MSRAGSYTLWASPFLILASSLVAQPYAVRDLGTFPGGIVSQGQALNQLGQVAGYARFSNFNAHGFFWDGDTGLHDLGSIPPESNFSAAQGINIRCQVAGYSTYNAIQSEHAVLWSRGQMHDLGTFPGGTVSEATGINDAGQIVGFANNAANAMRAFLWDPFTGMHDLGVLPGGYYSQGFAINVAGTSNAADGNWHGFFWSKSGGIQPLEFLPGGTSASANGINDRNQIAGGSAFAGCGFCGHAVVWTDDGVRDLGVLPGQGFSSAFAINNRGQVIGWSGSIAFIWSPEDGMRNLNDLISAGSGWQLVLPSAINDRGQITGQGNINGQSHAFLLTPR